MSYNSKYKGAEVEELLDSIGNKVDKVDGKQLSTEDFTTLLKQRLEGLSNYDDTEIQTAVRKLRTDLDTLVSGDTTTAIKTFNEIIAFLDGISDTEDLSSIIASIEQQIAARQEKLVSGANIKTINGESILGEGDVKIESGGSAAYPFLKPSAMPEALQPNTYYDLGQRAGFNINLAQGEEDVVNEYIFKIMVADSGSDLNLPSEIVWSRGEVPPMTIGKSYEISIIDNYAVFVEF